MKGAELLSVLDELIGHARSRNQDRPHYHAARAAVVALMERPGFMWVPEVPTEAMLVGAVDAWLMETPIDATIKTEASFMYTAMLAVAKEMQ